MFISERLLDDVWEYIEQKAEEKKQKKRDAIMQFVGMVNENFADMTVGEIKAKKRERYYEQAGLFGYKYSDRYYR